MSKDRLTSATWLSALERRMDASEAKLDKILKILENLEQTLARLTASSMPVSTSQDDEEPPRKRGNNQQGATFERPVPRSESDIVYFDRNKQPEVLGYTSVVNSSV